MVKLFSYVCSLALLVIGFTASSVQAQTIVDIAVENEDFSALVEAVVAQGLVETLQGEGPFTVFAPTNEAFSTLPSYVGAALEKNPDLLTDILTYHVVAGSLASGEVVRASSLETVQGSSLTVSEMGGAYYVDKAMISAVDVEASNGVIHVIDSVLIPPTVYSAVLDDIEVMLRQLQMMIGGLWSQN